MRWHRIRAMALRHVYLFRRSPFRLLEMVYWPVLDLVLWGFVSLWLRTLSGGGTTDFVALFLGGLILWDLMFRAQQGVSLAYLEEVWSRNLMNLFVSPLTVAEFLASTMVVSLAKLCMSGGSMLTLAWLLYGYDMAGLGVAILPFVGLLVVFGWSLGTVTTALVLRFGQGAESLVWVLAFAIQPVACVFYPLDTLPAWLRPVALANTRHSPRVTSVTLMANGYSKRAPLMRRAFSPPPFVVSRPAGSTMVAGESAPPGNVSRIRSPA